MSLFVIDTAGTKDIGQSNAKYHKSGSQWLDNKPRVALAAVDSDDDGGDGDAQDEDDFFALPPPSVDLSEIIESTLLQTATRKSKTQQQLEAAEEAFKMASERKNTHKRSSRGRIAEIDHSDFDPYTKKYKDDAPLQVTDVKKELKSATLQGHLEKLKGVPNLNTKTQRELNRKERDKSKGPGWFGLPAQELTEELQNDLKILQMRSVLDPKHFYKKNDLKVLPKYFQVGTVQHSPLDYYHERDTRRNKKRTLVDELLADNEALQYTKRKYKEVMARKDKYAHRKVMKKMKKAKKNK